MKTPDLSRATTVKLGGDVTIEPNLSAAYHAKRAAWNLSAVLVRQEQAAASIKASPGSADAIAGVAAELIGAHERAAEVHAITAVALALTANGDLDGEASGATSGGTALDVLGNLASAVGDLAPR